MHWNQINPKLRILYNEIANAHSENFSASKSYEKAFEIMEELTNILNAIKED